MKTQHVSLRQIAEGIELRKGSEGGGPTRTNEVRERMMIPVDYSPEACPSDVPPQEYIEKLHTILKKEVARTCVSRYN